jgi:hypothetical protein
MLLNDTEDKLISLLSRNDPRFSDQLAVDSKNVITHKNKGVHDEEKLQQCL